MGILTFRASFPLKWPDGWERTDPAKRKYDSAFQVSTEKALQDLKFELNMMGVAEAELTSWLPVSSRSGEVLLSSARQHLDDPGVALRFIRGSRELFMARDRFCTPMGNLRSIGLAIEGLRTVMRHGGEDLLDRAFEGFTALPPPGGVGQKPPRPWREVLGLVGLAGPSFAVLAGAEAAYKTLAREHHPDNGGDQAKMAEINAAIGEARRECGQ